MFKEKNVKIVERVLYTLYPSPPSVSIFYYHGTFVKTNIIIYRQLKSRLGLDSTRFAHWCSFFALGEKPGHHMTFTCMCPQSPLVCGSFLVLLVLLDHNTTKGCWSVSRFVKWPLVCACLMFTWWGYGLWGGKCHRDEVSFSSYLGHMQLILTQLLLGDVNFDLEVKAAPTRFLCSEVTTMPLSIFFLVSQVTIFSPQLKKGGELKFHLWRASVATSHFLLLIDWWVDGFIHPVSH